MSNQETNDVNVTFRANRDAELVVEFSVVGPSATTTGSSRLSPSKAQDIALNVLRAQGVVDERTRIVAALRGVDRASFAKRVTYCDSVKEAVLDIALNALADDIEAGRL